MFVNDELSATHTVSNAVSHDHAHRRVIVGAEPMVVHCHHYNAALQRFILDAGFVDSRSILVAAAAEVAHAQLTSLFTALNLRTVEQRARLASSAYRWSGFGTFDLSGLSADGGRVVTRHSHYAMAVVAREGQPADEPVCYFATGWLAGATAAIHGEPLDTYDVEHAQCSATTSNEVCAFEVHRRAPSHRSKVSPGLGRLTEPSLRRGDARELDTEGIYRAVASLPLEPTQGGSLPAFGVYLTRHFANYYNRISFELLRRAMDAFGEAGKRAVEPILVEAAHVCAFNTFGGIMHSTEWDALVYPSLRSREDWVYGMVAVVNGLGWGRWEVFDVGQDGARFEFQSDYESVGYEAMYGAPPHCVSYLHCGAAAGLMNLVYRGRIEERPNLTRELYNRLFRGDAGYRYEVLSHRAESTVIEVSR